jgi:hypothetical protein
LIVLGKCFAHGCAVRNSITVDVGEDILTDLNESAKKYGVTLSLLVRLALRQGLPATKAGLSFKSIIHHVKSERRSKS